MQYNILLLVFGIIFCLILSILYISRGFLNCDISNKPDFVFLFSSLTFLERAPGVAKMGMEDAWQHRVDFNSVSHIF